MNNALRCSHLETVYVYDFCPLREIGFVWIISEF